MADDLLTSFHQFDEDFHTSECKNCCKSVW